MKKKSIICAAAASLISVPGFVSHAGAAVLTWNPAHDATPDGGPGTWDTTHSYWGNGASFFAWVNATPGNTATFPPMVSPPATVTLGANVTVGAMNIMGDGYTISDGANLITLAASTPPSIIQVAGTSTGTLAVGIAGNTFTKTGTGTLVLTGTNTYTGLTTVSNGVLLGTPAAFTGSISIGVTAGNPSTFGLMGGTLANNFGAASISASTATLESVSTTAASVLSGKVVASEPLTLSAVSGGTLGISGQITGTSGLIVNTVGPVAIVPASPPANSFAGGTQVQQGTLYIQRAGGGSVLGSGSVQVSSGATLDSGNATVDGDLNVASGGILDLLQSDGATPANLNVGGVTSMAGSTFDVQTEGNGDGTRTLVDYSQLVTAGNVDITGATLNIGSIGYTPSPGDTLYIVDLTNSASTLTGTFAGLPQGQAFAVKFTGDGTHLFKIFYDADAEGDALTGGNDVALVALPEPSSLALGAGLLTTLMARRSRKRLA